MIILVILLYSLLFYLQFKPLVKEKQSKEIWLNVVLGTIALLITAIISLGYEIPSPPLERIVLNLLGK